MMMKRLCGLSLGLLAVVACDDGVTTTTTTNPTPQSPIVDKEPAAAAAPAPALDAKQSAALAQLTAATHTRWVVEENARVRTPAFLAPRVRSRGPRMLTDVAKLTPAMATEKTIAFFATNKDLFKMIAPERELVAKDVTIDDNMGMTHVRLAQVERGVPVVGGEMYAHYDREGRLTSVQGHYAPDLHTINVTPKLSASDAIAKVERGSAEPRLIVWVPALEGTKPPSDKPVLAWEVISRADQGWFVRIDAVTGVEIDRESANENVKGSGVGVKGETRQLECATFENGGFALADQTRPAEIRTFDLKNQADFQKATILQSNTTTSWDRTNKVGAGSAVDAHVNVGVIYDFFKKTFNRKGWDDKDGILQNLVHDGALPDNASFNRVEAIMIYGDGKEVFQPLAGALDVVAHEFAHGFTFFTSNLHYEGQSGAVNEAISDAFGAIVEHAVKPDATNNWLMGEGFMLDRNAKALRDMANPSAGFEPQPSHMKQFVNTQQDNGGVHINSGIINKASHLMTLGGKHPVSNVEVPKGIGWDKVAQLWYRTNQRYLIASADFGLTAKGTLEAAADLKFTPEEIAIIDCAWKATGVIEGNCGGATAPSNTPAGDPTTPTTDTNKGADEGDDDDGKTNDEGDTPKKGSTTTNQTQTGSGGCSMASPTSHGNGVVMGLLLALTIIASRRRNSPVIQP